MNTKFALIHDIIEGSLHHLLSERLLNVDFSPMQADAVLRRLRRTNPVLDSGILTSAVGVGVSEGVEHWWHKTKEAAVKWIGSRPHNDPVRDKIPLLCGMSGAQELSMSPQLATLEFPDDPASRHRRFNKIINDLLVF